MFPPEIFTEIFSLLSSEARVLVACSQAHPILAQLVEPSLYAHVIIHHQEVDLEDEHHLVFRPSQLSALLSNNPRIINYVRSLCVELFQLYSDDGFMKEIIAILPELKLERIRLTFAHSDIAGDWKWFPIAFRTAFIACISTSSMREICLDEIYNIPLSSFADCAGLKRLTLCQNAVLRPETSSSFPHLEALELSHWTMDGHSRRFLSWALTHASELRSLTLRTPRKKVIRKFLPHLLSICSTYLVNLSIYYTNPIPLIFDAAPIEIDFPGLQSLERLRICTYTSSFKCPQNSDHNLVRCALFTIAQILQTPSLLKHLTLIICLRFRRKDITQVDWSPLASFLSDRLSSLQHTDLYIRAVKAEGHSEVSSDEVISTLSRCETLMSLVEAGYVSIKEEMDLDDNRISECASAYRHSIFTILAYVCQLILTLRYMFPPKIFSEIFSILHVARSILSSRNLSNQSSTLMLSLTMIMPTPMKMGTIAKPYRLSTLLFDSPRILNYLRSLCVELSQLYEAEND